MPAMNLPKGSVISLAAKNEYDPLNPGAATWHALSEHNRAPLSIDTERIEKATRTARGSLRKWFIADKKTISTSWENLPHLASKTVDGKWGGAEIEAFYVANYGDFWVQVRQPDGTTTVYNMVFKSFGKSVQKRGVYEFWNIDASFEEV
jgi:hypothetical protein